MKKFSALLAALVLSGAGPAFAAEEAAATKPAEVAPAPEKVHLATELDALRPLLGKVVAVEGKLERLGANRGQTMRYLNFTADYRDSVALVFVTGKGGETFTREKLAEWLGKRVQATGQLAEHNGNLQIEIEKWAQLRELPEPAPAPEPAKIP